VGQEGVDTQRRGRYSAESVRGHPGKMLPEIARRLILGYTRPGDRVLDPMSGIGTVGVEAVPLGRHYVGVELETRFVAWQRENLERARADGATGESVVLRGDARRLVPEGSVTEDGAVPVPPVDAVLTSPPYGNRLNRQLGRPSTLLRHLQMRTPPHAIFSGGYGKGDDNIGNLPDTTFLREMGKVYAGCFAVLRPGGILAVVIRPGRDGRRLRPLHHETARLCREAGFEFLDEVVAVLARVEAVASKEARLHSHALFFRRLAVERLRGAGWPVTLEQTEYVLLFRKPGPPRLPEEDAIGDPGTVEGRGKGGLPAALACRLARQDAAG
jgi:DNA modification methylase